MAPLFKYVLAAVLFMVSNAAIANDKPPEERAMYRSFRVGACGGWTADCMVGAVKLDFSPRYIGASVSTGLIWGSATLKAFPVDYSHSEKVSWRPYVYYGGAYLIMSAGIGGMGFGADVLLLKSKRLLLQPSVGYSKFNYSYPAPEPFSWIPGGQLSVMAAF